MLLLTPRMPSFPLHAISFLRPNLIANITKNINLKVLKKISTSRTSKMKIVQFTYPDDPDEVRAGYLHFDRIVDLNCAHPSLPTSLVDILKSIGTEGMYSLKCLNPKTVALDSVKIEAPISNIDKVICIALNYWGHCYEHNLKPPECPVFFNKFPSTITGPYDEVILRTNMTQNVDWEVELAVVIGKKASFVKAADAYNYVFGYTVAQDISARDWQKKRNGGQFLLGKSMDTFCPIGPWIVTGDEVGDPQCLDIKCSVNGILKQNSNTSQLINKIPDVIERLSSVMTLYPGDIILTGTPGGVGMYRDPPEYLKPGDIICSEIQNIGVLQTVLKEFC